MTDEQLAEIEAQARSVASRSQWYYLLDDAAFGRLAAEETVPDLLAEVRRLRAELAVCLSTKGGGWACAAS